MLMRSLGVGAGRRDAYKRVELVCRRLSGKLDVLDHSERLDGCLSTLPAKAKVVICGGGMMGAAVAYHLARRGWGNNTVVIEKEL